MSNFAILRTQKIHSWSSVRRRAGHNERVQPPSHAWTPDPKNPDERRPAWISEKPVYLAGGPGFYKDWYQRVKTMKLRKLRDDQRHVLARELFLGASPEFFKGKSRAEVEQWAAESVEWAKERFGAERVGQAVLHLDEQTPHVHCLLLGLKKTKDGFTLSDRALGLGGHANEFVKLQDEYAARMTEKFSLDRGRRGSPATYQQTKDWRRQMTAPTVVPRVRWGQMPTPTIGDRVNPQAYAKKAARVAFKGVENHHAAMIQKAKEVESLRRERWKLLDQLNNLKEHFGLMAEALGHLLGLGRPFEVSKDLAALRTVLTPKKPTPAPAEPAPKTENPARREPSAGVPSAPHRRPGA